MHCWKNFQVNAKIDIVEWLVTTWHSRSGHPSLFLSLSLSEQMITIWWWWWSLICMKVVRSTRMRIHMCTGSSLNARSMRWGHTFVFVQNISLSVCMYTQCTYGRSTSVSFIFLKPALNIQALFKLSLSFENELDKSEIRVTPWQTPATSFITHREKNIKGVKYANEDGPSDTFPVLYRTMLCK